MVITFACGHRGRVTLKSAGARAKSAEALRLSLGACRSCCEAARDDAPGYSVDYAGREVYDSEAAAQAYDRAEAAEAGLQEGHAAKCFACGWVGLASTSDCPACGGVSLKGATYADLERELARRQAAEALEAEEFTADDYAREELSDAAVSDAYHGSSDRGTPWHLYKGFGGSL